VLNVLCVRSALDLLSVGSVLCWICFVLDLLSGAALGLLCVGTSLCWSCSVLELYCVEAALGLLCVGAALRWIRH
jgi:hypothetical protein